MRGDQCARRATTDRSYPATEAFATGLVAPGARADWSWGSLAWRTELGHGASPFGDPALDARSAVSASARTPAWGGWRAELVGAGSLASTSCPSGTRAPESRVFSGEARLSYQVGRSGVWLGYGAARATTLAGVPQPDPGVNLGLWHQWGSALVSVVLGSGADRSSTMRLTARSSGSDSIATDSGAVPRPGGTGGSVYDSSRVDRSDRRFDGRAQLLWARGRWTLDAAAGARLRPAGRDSLPMTPITWGRARATFAIGPHIALVGSLDAIGRDSRSPFGTPPGDAFAWTDQVTPFGERSASLGVRLSGVPFSWHRRSTPERATALAFDVRLSGSEELVVRVRAPHARTVEMSGDLTGWTAIRLAAALADWWETRLRAPRGTYHVNLRVDGERWIAPPGLPSVRDDFGGDVGLLVVR